jgi:DNA polymerase-3 subunit alpha
MAAVLTADLDNTEKVVHMLKECRQMGLTLLPPDINQSAATFTVVSPKSLRYGLGAIKGAGEAALTGVLEARDRDGQFVDLFDFCCRTHKQINRRVIEALIDSGAMDGLKADRATLHANLTKALEVAQQVAQQAASGQNDLFGGSDDTTDSTQSMNNYTPTEPWTLTEQLIREKAVLGFFVSGHPFDAVREQANAFAYTVNRLPAPKPNEAGKRGGQMLLLAGRIDSIRSKIGKKGDKLIFIGIEDQDQVQEVSVFGELSNQLAGQIHVDQLVVVEGELSLDGYSGQPRLRATRILPFEQAKLTFAKTIDLVLMREQLTTTAEIDQLVQQLRRIQKDDGIPIRWLWQTPEWQLPLTSQQPLRIAPTTEWLEQVQALGARVTLVY